MTVLRKIVALIALLAAAVLMFVVVCPITPTPTAVITSRNTAPIAILAVAPAVGPLLLAVFVSTIFKLRWFSDAREVSAPLTVLNRTCIQLC